MAPLETSPSPDPAEEPRAAAAGPSGLSRPAGPPHGGHVDGRTRVRRGMLWVLAVLLAMIILPPVLEKISYHWTRGRQRASRESLEQLTSQAEGQTAKARHELSGLSITQFAEVSRLVAEAVGPSVVYVNTVRDLPDSAAAADERMFSGGPGQRRELYGQGSGVIVDEAGYVLTNFHVIGGASEISVHLNGQRARQAEVVGVDPDTDLAVLKISGGNLVPIPWGDSDKLQVGDPVWAVGSPFGLDNSVTFGIIGAKGRRGVGIGRYQDFLQTDAAINPGNSGGALVNMRGELVGINTAIVSNSGIGFAIPSDLARDVYERLKKSGQYARGWLGVQLRELTPELADELKLPENQHGALVSRVLPDTPAARGDLQAGDLIVAVNDKEINDPTRLSLVIAATEPDSVAKIVVIRNGQRQTLSVEIGKMPKQMRSPS